MKKILLILSICVTGITNAQFTGKPIYNIRVERADTLLGNIEVEMFPTIAPNHVENWDSIVMAGGYDSTAFHRVISGFMIQGGDPNSVSGPTSTWGQGNASQANVDAEFSEVPHERGILSAARSSNPNSASSQFFICHGSSTFLDGDYSVYGQAISGMSVVDLIVQAPKDVNDLPNEKIEMFITRTGSNDSVPDSTTLISPLDQAVAVYSSTGFSWNAGGDVQLYKFEVATDNLFTNVVYTADTKNTSSSTLGLLPNTEYFWRVRVNNGGNLTTSLSYRQ